MRISPGSRPTHGIEGARIQITPIPAMTRPRTRRDDLGKAAKVDAKRVFATGMSNGAIITYRLASELSDRIAAVAPVSGPMGTEKCEPKRPVPVIHFHGTDDQFAPFKGGKGEKSLSGTNFYSVEHSIRAWMKANGCKEEPTTEELPDKAKDGTDESGQS